MRATGLDVRDIRIPRSIEPAGDLRAARAVRTLIREQRPDLVHTHLAKAGFIGRWAAARAGVPCVHTVYDYAFVDESGFRRWAYLWLERRAARWTQKILFISDAERRISESHGIGSPNKLVTMGFGVDLERFDPDRLDAGVVAATRRALGIPTGSIVIGTVARLVARKQVDKLIEAFAVLRKSRPAVHLLVVGGGPLGPELRQLADRLDVGQHTTFTGFVDDEERMSLLYAAMDVFCLLSRREGYGMAAAEAGAMGKPAVVLDISPVNEIVRDGETGFLVSGVEPAVERLGSLVDDVDQTTRMGNAARQHVRSACNLRDRFRVVLDVYDQVLRSTART